MALESESLTLDNTTSSSTENKDVGSNSERRMNDTTMPPPPPVTTRRVATTSAASKQEPTTRIQQQPVEAIVSSKMSAKTMDAAQKIIGKDSDGIDSTATNVSATKKREKIPPKTGFGLSDWNRLLQVTNDLAQRGGKPLRNKIPLKEVRLHNSVHDGWTILRGKVYCISPYLPYHPGGTKILKSILGKDATALFEKYHPWVNEERLVGKLLLGFVDPSRSSDEEDGSDDEA